MSTNLERDVEELRQRYAALEADTEAFRRDAEDTIRELLTIIDRQREAFEESAGATATVAAIRASNISRFLAWRNRLAARTRRMSSRWRQRAAARRRRILPASLAKSSLGANVAGYIKVESGMGEAVRWTIHALQRADIPVALYNVPGVQATSDETFSKFTDANPHPFNIVFLNADNMASFAADRRASYFRNHYTIGYWSWELEDFRPDWLPAFSYVDEVWVGTEFMRRSIGKNAPVPVVNVPYGPTPPVIEEVGRDYFQLPQETFVFLYTFDVSSQLERKNPLAAIRALRFADLRPDEAMLVLKFTNGHTDRDAVRRLADAAEGLNVRFIEGALRRPILNALMNATDACLSLHRAEGVGMTIAEHMAMGKPAIATEYSGNLDFMSTDVSCLVPAKLVEIDRDRGPYLRGYRWAEPDVARAAQFIRELVRTPGRARALGAAGQDYVTSRLNPDRTARLVSSRLRQIQTGRLRVSGIVPPPGEQKPEYR